MPETAIPPETTDMDRLVKYFEDKWDRFYDSYEKTRCTRPDDEMFDAYWSEVMSMLAHAHSETDIMSTVDYNDRNRNFVPPL